MFSSKLLARCSISTHDASSAVRGDGVGLLRCYLKRFGSQSGSEERGMDRVDDSAGGLHLFEAQRGAQVATTSDPMELLPPPKPQFTAGLGKGLEVVREVRKDIPDGSSLADCRGYEAPESRLGCSFRSDRSIGLSASWGLLGPINRQWLRLASCDGHAIIDCAFSAWSPWQGLGGCSGLGVRSRKIARRERIDLDLNATGTTALGADLAVASRRRPRSPTPSSGRDVCWTTKRGALR